MLNIDATISNAEWPQASSNYLRQLGWVSVENVRVWLVRHGVSRRQFRQSQIYKWHIEANPWLADV